MSLIHSWARTVSSWLSSLVYCTSTSISVPVGGLYSGTNCTGWPGTAPSASSPVWTRKAFELTDTIDSCSLVLRVQANISSMPSRSETMPSTITMPSLGSTHTS